jgi:hypothetical protein
MPKVGKRAAVRAAECEARAIRLAPILKNLAEYDKGGLSLNDKARLKKAQHSTRYIGMINLDEFCLIRDLCEEWRVTGKKPRLFSYMMNLPDA